MLDYLKNSLTAEAGRKQSNPFLCQDVNFILRSSPGLKNKVESTLGVIVRPQA